MSLHDSLGALIDSRDLFTETAKLLMEGNIMAVKGIGGIHLVSLATRDDVLDEFRRRKDRKNQPYALMSPDIDTIRSYALLNQVE